MSRILLVARSSKGWTSLFGMAAAVSSGSATVVQQRAVYCNASGSATRVSRNSVRLALMTVQGFSALRITLLGRLVH